MAHRRGTELLATLAHELGNPFAHIRNGLELVESMDDVPPDVARLHAMMSRQVGQLTRLVDDLLDLARISRDKIELRRESVRLSEIVDAAVDACHPMLEDKAHALVDAFSAMGASMVLAWTNLPVVLAWGALVLVLFAASLATGLVGLVIVFPLLGHATWHAYKAIRPVPEEVILGPAIPEAVAPV